MEGLSKEQYIGIVKFTLNSMIELADINKDYDIILGLVHYYDKTIKTEGILTREEFLELATRAGIEWK